MPRPYDTSYSPFPIGMSPFRVKGVLYQGTQQFFNETIHGGMETLLGQIGPGPLAEFIGQKFLPASFYDALAIPALVLAEAEACRLPTRAYMAHRSKWQAARDIGGVYRLMLKVTSPETVALRLPKVLTQMLSFGKLTNEITSNAAKTVVSEFPEPLVPWLTMALDDYTRTALELAGAKKSRSKVESVIKTGVDRGVALVSVTLRVQWE